MQSTLNGKGTVNISVKGSVQTENKEMRHWDFWKEKIRRY